MTSIITFECSTCKTTVTTDENNPPNDGDIISCTGCGHEFGIFAVVKKAAIDASKAEINKIARKYLGKGLDWEIR